MAKLGLLPAAPCRLSGVTSGHNPRLLAGPSRRHVQRLKGRVKRGVKRRVKRGVRQAVKRGVIRGLAGVKWMVKGGKRRVKRRVKQGKAGFKTDGLV